MAFCRRWLLFFILLAVNSGPVWGATTREQRALMVAQETFNENIFDRAETQLAEFIKKYPGSTRVPEAALLEAQAQFRQGKFSEALETLAAHRDNAGGLTEKYLYWTGETQFKMNDYAAAAESFSTVARNFSDSPLRLSAAVAAAAAWEKAGAWTEIRALLGEPGSVFQGAARTNAGSEQVINGRLLLARALAAQKDFAAATETLSALDGQSLTPEQRWKKNSLLFSAKLATGEMAAALAVTTNLLELARSETNSEWLADAFAKRGAVQESLDLNTEASATLKENLSTNAPVEKQREAILKIAALAAAQNNFTNAEAALATFLVTAPEAPVAQLVRLTLGELQLKDLAATNHLAAARGQFDQLLADAPDSPLAGKAFLGRGWANWLAEKYGPALADFKNAVARLPVTNDLAAAIFKAADAEFELGKFTEAREDYRLVLQRFSGSPAVMRALGDRALYQIVRVNLELKDRAGTEAALKELLDRFPKTEAAENALLLAAGRFSDFNSPATARELLRQFDEKFPGSPLRPQADFVLARTYEQETNWVAAITNHDAWLKNFPTNRLLPQVTYEQAWANFQAGREANAFLLFSNFAAQFPANTNAPLALWLVADDLFRAHAFEAAEKNYELVYQTEAWKNSPLFYPAQMMAGRAAMGRYSYKDAEAHFVPLLTDSNCPAEWQIQARFAYGAVLKEMPSADTNNPLANVMMATNIYNQIYRANPTNEAGLRARGELADCYAQLGDYTTATNLYLLVANTPSEFADAALRARAKVALGQIYEKIAASLPAEQRQPYLDLAKNAYLDVVDSATNPGREEMANSDWVKKAGLLALPLLKADGENHANFFARLEVLLPQLKETLEKKKAALSAVKN